MSITSILRALAGRVTALACNKGDVQRLLSFFHPKDAPGRQGQRGGQPRVCADFGGGRSRDFESKDLPCLRWTDSDVAMVVIFAEVARGARIGPLKRQNWVHAGRQ